MRESRMLGSVRGVLSNGHPYRKRRVPFSTPRLARVSGQLVINHTIDQQVMFEVFPRVSYCTSGYRACPAVAHAPMREVHPWR